VARGTQHRKRRPTPNASVGPPPKAKKPKHESWEDQLFFSRLRVHAKWVFVLLAVVFAMSFVLFGVGSGSSGIGDIFQNLFNGTSSSGPSASSLQKKADANPQDAKTWRQLATALEQKSKIEEAIAALDRYTKLKPKDESALQELGGLYLRRADDFAREYVAAQSKEQTIAPGSSFKLPPSSPLAAAFVDPIASGISQSTSKVTSAAYAKYVATQGKAVVVYRRLSGLNPKDATNQYRLAQVAQAAGETATAITAYKTFLKLAPDDSLAPAAKKALKQLTAPSTPAVSAG
jgi:DNA-binding SARP family transcriptional activator